MLITEKNLLFPKEVIDRRIYSCLNKKNLLLGLCKEKFVDSDCYEIVYPFPTNKEISPWRVQLVSTNDLLIEDLVNYKVVSQEELMFMLSYAEKKELDLETLVDLKKEYKRCSFIVDSNTFLDLLSNLSNFSNLFKYSSLTSFINYKDMNYTNEYAYMISVFDINTVFNNIYKSAFSGVCMSFEILSMSHMLNKDRAIIKGAYFVLTNNYKGIFYKDGRDGILDLHPDFVSIFTHMSSKISKYNSDRKLLNSTFENAPRSMAKVAMKKENFKKLYGDPVLFDTTIKITKKVREIEEELEAQLEEVGFIEENDYIDDEDDVVEVYGEEEEAAALNLILDADEKPHTPTYPTSTTTYPTSTTTNFIAQSKYTKTFSKDFDIALSKYITANNSKTLTGFFSNS